MSAARALAGVQVHGHKATLHVIVDKACDDFIKGFTIDGSQFCLSTAISDALNTELRHCPLRRASERAAKDAGEKALVHPPHVRRRGNPRRSACRLR